MEITYIYTLICYDTLVTLRAVSKLNLILELFPENILSGEEIANMTNAIWNII